MASDWRLLEPGRSRWQRFVGVVMTGNQLADYCRALGAIYDEAIRLLKSAELKPFLIHEVTWLNNTPRAEDPQQLLELHLRQARDYLDRTIDLRNQRRPPTLRVFTVLVLTWLLERAFEVRDWLDRLT
jgi:hypothetical protein